MNSCWSMNRRTLWQSPHLLKMPPWEEPLWATLCWYWLLHIPSGFSLASLGGLANSGIWWDFLDWYFIKDNIFCCACSFNSACFPAELPPVHFSFFFQLSHLLRRASADNALLGKIRSTGSPSFLSKGSLPSLKPASTWPFPESKMNKKSASKMWSVKIGKEKLFFMARREQMWWRRSRHKLPSSAWPPGNFMPARLFPGIFCCTHTDGMEVNCCLLVWDAWEHGWKLVEEKAAAWTFG